MKRIIPLALLIFLVGNITNANTINQNHNVNASVNYYNSHPITFVENGVTFYVFQNGTFNFDTNTSNYGMPIVKDNFGRIRSIGNTCINYDCQNRVNQIGNICMSYNQFALAQIGGLQLIYDYQGALINSIGAVRGYLNINVNYGTPYSRPYYIDNRYYSRGRFDRDDNYRGNFHNERENHGNSRNDFPRGRGRFDHDRRD